MKSKLKSELEMGMETESRAAAHHRSCPAGSASRPASERETRRPAGASSFRALFALLAVCGLGLGADPVGAQGPGPPVPVIEDRLAEISDLLELEGEQRAKVREIIDETREEAYQLRVRVRYARKRLAQELEGKSPEREPIKRWSDEIGKAEAKLREHQALTVMRVREVLTDEQRAELARLRAARGAAAAGPCRAEIEKLCPSARRPGDRLRCGLAHREELSEECRERFGSRGPRRGPPAAP